MKAFLYLTSTLSHTVFAVSLILVLHNILFDCNSTVFCLLLILLFLGHTIYFAMLKKLRDSLIPYSTYVESIVKHSILSFKNQTDWLIAPRLRRSLKP